MDKKECLIIFLKDRLRSYYERVRISGKTDEPESKYINGIMASIRVLGYLEKKDLEEIVKAVHYEVFGMNYEKRKMTQALSDGGEHWDFFEKPAISRKD